MHAPALAFAVAGSLLAPALCAQTLLRTIPGPTAGAHYGKALLRAGDQNGDGYQDLLVGAPGFNQGRGAVYCLSGAYLALGTGALTLWSIAPPATQGDMFGFALDDLGDMNGDGAREFVVGQPGYDVGSSYDVGAVRVIDGATHALLSLRSGNWPDGRFGHAVAAVGDSSGDGLCELAVGAPGTLAVQSRGYCFFDGTAFLISGSIGTQPYGAFTGPGSDNIGYSVISGFDLNGDGYDEIVFGAPGRDVWTVDAGTVIVAMRTPSLFGSMAYYFGQFPGDRMGSALDASHDYDGDGVVDIVAGAPNSGGGSAAEVGRAIVLSGARLATHTPSYEIYRLTLENTGPSPTDYHFGAAVCASGDLNNDGVGDILVGAPDFYTSSTGGAGIGSVSVFSGATGLQLAEINGALGDQLGDGLAGAVGDLDGDGFAEFVVAGSASNAGANDSGVLACYRLFPVAPQTYCTANHNSLGCTPSISFSGTPSESSAAPFLISATNFFNQRSGALLYAYRPAALHFQGGFRCVATPTLRTPAQSSGGSTSGLDCTGSYSFDFNAWIQSGPDPALVAGVEVFAQYWSPDPQGPPRASLSDALRLLVNP